MKIAIVSSAMPLVQGGARFIADWLEVKLRDHGHQVETLHIPTSDVPDEHLLTQANAFRLMSFDDDFDRVITLRPPAHLIRHRRKVVWFIHHLRSFYDMWDTPYRGFPDTRRNRGLRDSIVRLDNAGLAEAHRVFSNSAVVAGRLARFNAVAAEVLYPPVLRPELFTAGEYGDEIVGVCRMEHHKRQHFAVAAMALTRSQVRLRLCGTGTDPGYIAGLRAMVAAAGLEHRVTIDDRWITEAEKSARLATALASVYVPLDEDSYGYPTIEAAHAARCTVTVSDSGGVPEFVADGQTGLVAAPEPQALADAFDRLHADRALARSLGEAARVQIDTLGIGWDRVIARLLA